MIPSLPLFHTIAGQTVIVLGSGDVAEARRRLIERAGGVVIGEIQQGVAQGARLAFIARGDAALDEADAMRLRAAGLLVNTADRPELCDFTVPSILDRSPVVVAIGTGGASAGLAKALRLRLETGCRLGRCLDEVGADGGVRSGTRWWRAGGCLLVERRDHSIEESVDLRGEVPTPTDGGEPDPVDVLAVEARIGGGAARTR